MSGRLTAGAGRRLAVPASVGIIGLALLGIGQGVFNRHAIEDDLTSRSTEALESADLTGLSVSFAGRDATITGPGTAEAAQRAEAVVSAVDGVRVAKAAVPLQDGPSPTVAAASTPAVEPSAAEPSAVEPSAAASATAAAPVLPVGFTLANGTITVTGTVRSTSDQTDLINAVTMAGNDWQVVDRLNVNGSISASEPNPSRLPAVAQLLSQAPIDGPKLVIQYNRGLVLLRGAPANAGTELALLTAAAATVDTQAAVVDGLDPTGAG
jgi:hypothetical protein